ncbi:hypothetical protein B0T17DRAFT_612486 [Bombardia bombarda]|uniref:Uncharacterized protein n=1 Tax=Bombardia bombarda TaxID=252184 RepID=A0AA39XKF2_9PEZI|nr:hypothetical protein B0T17DRAFT_612486 [Bombardia bombarda]
MDLSSLSTLLSVAEQGHALTRGEGLTLRAFHYGYRKEPQVIAFENEEEVQILARRQEDSLGTWTSREKFQNVLRDLKYEVDVGVSAEQKLWLMECTRHWAVARLVEQGNIERERQQEPGHWFAACSEAQVNIGWRLLLVQLD